MFSRLKIVGKQMIFYPKLSSFDFGLFRVLGPGLGNLLFPFARCVVYREKYGGRILAPTWPQLKVGTILRSERDSRTYWGIFKNHPSYVSGVERQMLLLRSKKIEESAVNQVADSSDICVVSGMDGMFEPLYGYSQLIKNEVLSILSQDSMGSILKEIEASNSIAVHIRFGDFQAANIEKSNAGVSNTRLPQSWYISMIEKGRKLFGSRTRVNIFSDAKNSEISDILAIDNVYRVERGNAIEHILAIGAHKFFIASGSTFSMWASFLGQPSTVWFPGQLKQKLLEGNGLEFECGEFESFKFEVGNE